MSSEQGLPRRRHPRPVVDAPVDALLARIDDLSKGWLVALIEQGELEDAPAILAAEIVRDGPRLCDAIVRALADDDDLRRLEPGGALERLSSSAGELAGATVVESSVRAVDALRAVIWSALRAELKRPDPDHVEALAERLALVSELVRAAVLRRFAATEADGAAELADAGEGFRPLRLSPWEAPVSAALLWRDAFDDEVAQAQRSGAKLALLLAELGDAGRGAAAEPVDVAREPFGRFAQAVRTALRREDILACESESRAWIIARATGRTGARALGSRIVAAVQEAEPGRGAPGTVGIGIAILGEDAHDSAGLIEAAHDWTFAAVSAGEDASVLGGPPAVS